MSLKRTIYKLLRLSNDIKTVRSKRGRKQVGRRVAERVARKGIRRIVK